MGYETRVYVVDKKCATFPDKKYWGQVISMIDVSNFPTVSDFMRKQPATDCYIYSDDGSTQILEDRYGQPLKECDVEDLFAIVDKAVTDGEDYRRVFPLHAMLKSFVDNKHRWQNLKVLHFGY